MVRTPAALSLALALLAGLACGEGEAPEPPAAPEAAPARPPRGLWVLCEGSQRVLEHPERIPALIADARRLGVTDLFVQVYRGGRAWFDSSHADAAPYRALREATGGDSLARLITTAHRHDLRVHAWVNVLSLAGNRRAPILQDLGPDAVLVDRAGRSLLDYPKLDVPEPDRRYYRMGTPAVWLDPAAPGVEARLAQTFAELLTRYPELDGLHLDYIRYPDVLPFVPGSRFGVGLDFGYGPASRARFRSETGLEPPGGDSLANANAWDAWRRDRVTGLVAALGAAARSVIADIAVSAAVWSWADRAYLALGQDWRRWLEDGLIEFAVPMAYTLDDRLLRYQAESFAGLPQRDRVWVGLGSWLFAARPEQAREQVRIVRAAGAAGDSLFSWDAIAEAPALADALAAEASDGATPAEDETETPDRD
jgi:uncharacterized lipoprotein YddW (UPF0748 family)